MENKKAEIRIIKVSDNGYLVIEKGENGSKFTIFDVKDLEQSNNLLKYISDIELTICGKDVVDYKAINVTSNDPIVIITTSDGSVYEISQDLFNGTFKEKVVASKKRYDEKKEEIKPVRNLTINHVLTAVVLFTVLMVGVKIGSFKKESNQGNQPVVINPNNETDASTRNIMLFIHGKPVPNTFDVRKDFAGVITDSYMTNVIYGRLKYLKQDIRMTKIKEETRKKINLEHLFKNEKDKKIIKHFEGNQQAILDAIYDNKPQGEVAKMIFAYLKEAKDFMLLDKEVNGLKYCELSDYAKYTKGIITGTVMILEKPSSKNETLIKQHYNIDLNNEKCEIILERIKALYNSRIKKQSSVNKPKVLIEASIKDITEHNKVYAKIMQ